ncbi:TRAP transporter substrate-binding protein [Mameliella alba]|uniref:TRAP transporter substrate-binding protein n=1 Tax=Mameliella alba TaxID=561184 RepID=UPI000945689B|nr:hypothetical protein [Mameliella alba]GGF57863.1 hypothetical protein GCM10011319_18930 [Mameliella alba]
MLATATASGLGGVAAVAEPITLKIADSLPSGHLINETIMNVMIPALEDSGEFTVEYFPAAQLGAAGENLDFARSGVIDIGYFAPGCGSMAGRVPATNALTLPGLISSSTQATKVYMELGGGALKQEYDKLGIKLLVGVGTSPYQVFSKKEVRLADAFIAKISGRGFGYVEDVYAEILDLAEKHAE